MCCVKIKAHCVIRASLACHREKTYPSPFSQKNSRRLELSISKTPRPEGGDKVPGSVDPRFPAGLPFPVPEILEFVAFRDSGKFFQQFSRDFPRVLLGNPRTDPGNSHSLLEFSDLGPPHLTVPDPCMPKPLNQDFMTVPLPQASFKAFLRSNDVRMRSTTTTEICRNNRNLPFRSAVSTGLFRISQFLVCQAGPRGVSTKGVSMNRSNLSNFRAFYTVVSKRDFQKSP